MAKPKFENYTVIEPVTLRRGAIVSGLNKVAVGRRGHLLRARDDLGEGVFEVLEDTTFKTGERFASADEFPKAIAQQLTPTDAKAAEKEEAAAAAAREAAVGTEAPAGAKAKGSRRGRRGR